MSIQSIRPEAPRVADVSALQTVATGAARPKLSDVPENVFAPPGVFARLTAILQTYHTSDAPRPEIVVRGKDLASRAAYPGAAELSQVASELLGGGK